MDCIEVRDRLSDLEDGSLPETSENEIRHHLLGCADCSAVARSLEAVREGLRRLPPVPAPPELLERINEAISREMLVSDATAQKGNADTKSRSTGYKWKFPLEAAAAIALFAAVGWYMAGSIPGKATSQAELSAPSSVTATAETAALLPKPEPPQTVELAVEQNKTVALLPKPEPPSVAATAGSAKKISGIQRAEVPVNQAPVRTAKASSRAISEYSPPPKPAARASQSEERSIATLPEGMAEPKIRVYSLADLPAAPVLRTSTRFARVKPYAPATTTEAEPAHHANAAESRTTRLRPPVPYGMEISLEVVPEEREEMADRIARAAKRLGGMVEQVDRYAPEGTIAVRVLLPERTAQAFIDDLWRNGKLPPEGLPSRSILPAGPKPGIIAYTVHLQAH